MFCPNCKKRARVINSQEKENQRLRQYRCDNCHTYIITRESVLYHYKADEEQQKLYASYGNRKEKKEE